MTLSEYIDSRYRFRRDNLTEEVCRYTGPFGGPPLTCTPVLGVFIYKNYSDILNILKPFMSRLEPIDETVANKLVEAGLLPPEPDIRQLCCFEIGRIILSRTQAALYESGNYVAPGSIMITGWLKDDFEYDYPIPPELRTWFIHRQGRTEYDAGVKLDLLIMELWRAIESPQPVIIQWEASERDWIHDKLSDIMDWFGSIYTTIFETMFGTWWQFVITVVAFYYIIGPALVEAIVQDAAVLNAMYGTQVTYMGEIYFSASAFVEALGIYYGAFLAFIHYDTIIGIHSIAFIVSRDYREMMNRVYLQISEISNALGYGPHFLTLFLRNTRSLVLDASTRMGMRYDLAEVQWLGTLEEYSQILSARAHRYRDNPEALFFDMGELIERPILDSSGIFSQTIITTIQNTIVGLESVINEVTAVTDGLADLIAQLPDTIQAQITPITGPIIQRMDEFLRDTYGPSIATLNALVDTISTTQGIVRGDIDNVVDRLKKPGTLLLSVDDLAPTDREHEEDTLSEVTSRGHTRNLTAYEDETDDDLEAWQEQTEEIETHRPPPIWDIPERGRPSRVAITDIEIGETWFIGDF